MKLIFAGTPVFAATALQALIDAGHEIALVLTQPDRPAGRGMQLKASEVKTLASKHNLRVAQPVSLKKDESAQGLVRDTEAEAMIVAAYGLILPSSVLEMPVRGCLNIHASLLPRWRGAAPIQRAIEAGDRETGITIMQMNEGLDTGDILGIYPLSIDEDDTAASLTQTLAVLGGHAIIDTLANLDSIEPVKQPETGVTYATKIDKFEGIIDWTESAEIVTRRIRAFNPVPGASTSLDGKSLKLWQAKKVDQQGEPGQVLCADADGIVIAAGCQAVQVSELQIAGGKRLVAKDFIAGHRNLAGHFLGRDV